MKLFIIRGGSELWAERETERGLRGEWGRRHIRGLRGARTLGRGFCWPRSRPVPFWLRISVLTIHCLAYINMRSLCFSCLRRSLMIASLKLMKLVSFSQSFSIFIESSIINNETNLCWYWFDICVSGTKLKYKPGIVMGGRHLVHDCGVSQSIGYFLEPLILLGLFAKKPLTIKLKGTHVYF